MRTVEATVVVPIFETTESRTVVVNLNSIYGHEHDIRTRHSIRFYFPFHSNSNSFREDMAESRANDLKLFFTRIRSSIDFFVSVVTEATVYSREWSKQDAAGKAPCHDTVRETVEELNKYSKSANDRTNKSKFRIENHNLNKYNKFDL